MWTSICHSNVERFFFADSILRPVAQCAAALAQSGTQELTNINVALSVQLSPEFRTGRRTFPHWTLPPGRSPLPDVRDYVAQRY